MKVSGYVYIITNKINGKIYIGITRNEIKVRWQNHQAHSKKQNTYFYRSIRKYGIDNFECRLLKTCFSNKQLYFSERYFIKINKSHLPEFGYNLSIGGEQSALKNEEPRNTGILFKLSKEEKRIWKERVKEHGGTAVDCFIDMVNTELEFQNSLKPINLTQ